MIEKKTQLRVRYAETDQMGYSYYGNYAEYFEVARVEVLRDLGFPYKEMEDSGFMLPVAELSIQYKKPAFYDQLLTITSIIRELPKVKFQFEHTIHNEAGELLTTAQITLFFLSKESGKPCKAPIDFVNALKKIF